MTDAEAPSAWQALRWRWTATARAARADTALVGPCQDGRRGGRQRRGARPRPRLGRLRRRARQPHARPRRQGHAGRARDEAQLHEPAARGHPGRGPRAADARSAGRSASSSCTGSSRRSPGRSRRRAPGAARRLRADGRRRAAGRHVRHGPPAAAAAACSPATRPPGPPTAARRRRSRRPARSTTGSRDEGWDVALVGPGPGILGSGSALGHGGIVALDSAHAALALGCPTVLTARMSSGDPRERHRGLSHHTRTVLELLLAPVTLPVPPGAGCSRDGRDRRGARRRARARARRRRDAGRRRRLPRERPADAHDGPHARRGPRSSSPPRSRPAARWRSRSTRGSEHDASSRSAARQIWSGHIGTVRVERYRHADGEVVTRENVAHPGAVAIVADRRRARVADPPAARDLRRARRCWRSPPASSTSRRGGPAARRPSASWPRRSARRPSTWEHLKAIYTSPGFTDERIDVYLATDLRDVERPPAEEDERIEIVAWPLDRLDDAIAAVRATRSR